jgi:hypothetical protein
MRNFVIMTDQLKIDAMNKAAMMANPEKLVSWNAKSSPPEARKPGARGRAMTQHSRSRGRAGKFAAWVAGILMLAPGARAAEGQIYDVFAKALAPIASSVFGGAAGQPGAMVVECTVGEATGRLAAANGMKMRLAVQAPDHLRVDLAYNGTVLTACRAGKELWATPAAPMRSLAQAAGIDVGKSAPDSTSPPLIPLALDPQMLVFLPVVFDVKDLGMEDINGTAHRGMQFGLMPELKKSIKAEDFDARAWINTEFQPRRVTVEGADYSLQVEVDKISFAPQFPPTVWQPAENQDVLRLPASALNELFEKMLAQKLPANLPLPAPTGP